MHRRSRRLQRHSPRLCRRWPLSPTPLGPHRPTSREVVDDAAFAIGLEDLLHEAQVERMLLIGVLGGLIPEDEVEADLLALIDDRALAVDHAAAVEGLDAGDRGEEFAATGEECLGRCGAI